MHKPSSVRSLSIPFRPYQLLSLPPYSPTRSFQPPSVLVALGRLFLFPLSTLAPFSYPLILSQPFSLRKRRSAIHPSSSFFFLSISIFLLCVSLFFFLSFFMRCSRTLHFLVNVLFFFLLSRIRENPCVLDFFSITPFPDRALPIARSFLKSSCSTSDYLTPLINSRHKSLGFGFFYGTRLFLKAREMEFCLLLLQIKADGFFRCTGPNEVNK